ncbi:hypothetical protein [Flavobacterium sp. CLA17]|uniref:hypothetical protein n=1 Tax=Flavobacterium sp. CLA17 TaxID=2724135 RepID=UPI001491F3BE|nr:hypothetical protein [Flavobacterium sp. CLA17]QSB26484.1 hypothetical protein HAV12_019280 [Flavobacterium sp. CLA17]
MERFIPQNSIISYFQYVLNKDGFIESEIIKFNDGTLEIKYIYIQNEINEITYFLKYNDGETLQLHKKFNLL